MNENNAYNVGVTNNVSKVAKVSPKIIVAAIPPNATSKSKGTIPKIVVVAAIKTGRVLEMVASMIESYGEIPLRRCVLIIPKSPNHPAIGKKPKSNPVSNIPIATPIKERGSTQRMIIG